MVGLLISALLHFVPTGAWDLASVAVYVEYVERRARVDVRAMQPKIGKVAPYFAVTFVAIFVGVIIWDLVAGIERASGSVSGAAGSLVSWLALSYALTASVSS